MFGTIRKHQSWLWFIIIGVMILTMITWTNQLGKSGNERAGGNFGVIDGHTVTESDYKDARNEAMLMYLLRNRQWPETRTNFNEVQETYYQLFFTRKLQEYNISTDKDAVARFANLILQEFGNGQPMPLEAFVDQQLKPHGMTAEDFERFSEHYLSLRQLESVVGLSGKLITPDEIKSLYVHEYQPLAVDAVFFSASNYLARVATPSQAELERFYTNEQANYRLPDQMQVSYVFFNVTNFMPEAKQQIGVTNLNRMTDEALVRIGSNTVRYGKTPEEVRAKISEILVQDTAISNAYRKAVEFQNNLPKKDKLTVEDLAALAREKGMPFKTSKPFDDTYGPSDMNLGPNYPVSALFNLTAEDPFVGQPIPGLDGVYIVAFDKSIPSHIPPLAEIHSRVAEDYKLSHAMEMAQINGRIFGQTVTNQMAQGKSFEAAATAAKVEAIKVPPFSLNTDMVPDVEDRVDLGMFKQVAFGTPVGKTSEFIPTREGGFVIYVKEKLPVDETKMKTDLQQFANIVRQRRQVEAFDLWLRRETSVSLANIPMLQQEQQRRTR